MAPIKRKADADALSSKPKKHSTENRSSKRPRKSDSAADAPKPSAKPSTETRNPVQASVFKDEERSFPRGGASVLTPLEHKQIQIKATQDVLFEQAGQKRAAELSDEEADAGSDDGTSAGAKSKKSRKHKKKAKATEEAEQRVRVESLSFKRLVPGSMVLGQVTEITSRDLVLALPNNLSGFVPMTAISDKLTTRIEKLVQEEENSDDDADESEDFEDIELKKLFFVGQYLRAFVTSASDNSTTYGANKGKKRIELTINPKFANRGISKSSLVVNSTVQASVVSNEDHGLVMDLGIEGADLKGFLSSNELGPTVEHSEVQEGATFLCLVTGLNADGRIVKLSTDQRKIGDVKKSHYLTDAPTIDVFLPGTAVDLLITESSSSAVTGKIMGHLDATADIIHSGAAETEEDFEEKYKVGSKVKARIICTFPDAEPKKVGVSLLDHVVSLTSRTSSKGKRKSNPLDLLPISSFVEEAKVLKVEPTTGLYLSIGIRNVIGFAHISRLTDEKIERLYNDSGPYKVGSTHRARIVGYNPVDGLFQLSLEQKVLDQPFLRIEDIKVGQVVKGKVEKLIVDKTGSTGVLVNLSEGITGLVPEMHLADVPLQHPDRKFREGLSVTARVLSTDPEKRHIRLTLKKTLVNSDLAPWVDYSRISKGASSPGTLVDVKRNGAVVQFYGAIRGWLPVSEMSETYIADATQHFRKGQVVNVHVVSITPEEGRMIVSCKDPNSHSAETETVFRSLSIGDIVKGSVIEKTADLVTVDLGNSIRGMLRLGHMSDGTEKKDKATMSRIRVGGPLEDLVILDKNFKSRMVTLTNKPSLRRDAQNGKLISRIEDVVDGETVHGFVRAIAEERIFVEFGGGVVGLLYKSRLPESMAALESFGFRKDESIAARVHHVDASQNRFWLTMKSDSDAEQASKPVGQETVNAVDDNLQSTSDLRLGTVTTARIRSVKSTQINVHIADNVQGRISVAEVFDDWDEIKDKKHPLRQFQMNQIIPVKVLGMHDARNHRFLPISHRAGKVPIFELSAKKKEKVEDEGDILTLDKVTLGSSWTAFINNISERFVWVNISANVRGRIDLSELSDDVSLLSNIEENFPVGSALKVRVKAVDANNGRLDLTAVSAPSTRSLTWDNLKPGLILPGKVTKIAEHSIIVHINDTIAGPVYREELADDYELANPSAHKVGEFVRVCVTEVNAANQRLGLSIRPSKILSSSLPVKDPELTNMSQLKVNQVVRGFVKKVTDFGLFVRLGPHLDAYVRIGDLSDKYIKDWKAEFKEDQLVTGKIISLNPNSKNPLMSLKASILEKDYVPALSFDSVQVGQIVTGKVRKVEDYGVIIVVDNSNNVSGLCHRTEIADKAVTDVKALYNEGDAVKAKILSVDPQKRRISFGLKYSYIGGSKPEDDEDDDAESVEMADEKSEASDVDYDDVEMREVQSAESEDEDMADAAEDEEAPKKTQAVSGLSTGGFDWTGSTLDQDHKAAAASDSDSDGASKKKKRHRKAEIKEDRTGDLDAHGPQSVADYERLLLGQPHSAELWVRYMVFQRELNEIEKARQIARRALATINPREEREKLDVWTALLHLENEVSNDDAIEEVFREACQFNDSRQIHERMIKIYISSGKLDKADSLFQSMAKTKAFTPDPSLWDSYATFLMTTLNNPPRARALLQRATQSVPESQHRYLTTKFAQLEFKSPNGDAERGRTIFEGLISAWPKKWDLWDVYLTQEVARGDEENVRALFERMTRLKMKKRRAEGVFKRWREWEKGLGNDKGVEKVEALEAQWREKREEGVDEE